VSDHDLLVALWPYIRPFALLALALAYLFGGMWLKRRDGR
jgi:hypothetical protein